MKITENWVNVSHSIGVPFGGIGTGYGVLGKFGFVLPNFNSAPCAGKYDDFNRLECYDYLNLHGNDRYNFLSLIISDGCDDCAFQSEKTDNDGMNTADSFETYEFLPFSVHRAIYDKPGFEVEMLAYSPLIPHNLAESSIPVLCMEISVKNTGVDEKNINLRFDMKDSGDAMTAVFAGGNTEYALTVKAGETAKATAFFAWYYPDFATPSAVMTEEYKRYYTLRFANCDDIICYAEKKHRDWKNLMVKWQDSFDVPPEFKRAWFSSLSSVITSTMLSTEPYFMEIESPHPYMNTMDVTIYSGWIYMINWPEIEKLDMYMYRDKIPSAGEDKGLVWHSLWSDRSDYVEEPCYITRIYRDYLWYNDKQFLEDMKRPVEDALNRVYSQKALDGLIESKHGNQSYDLWKMPGLGAYVNTQWLTALYSVLKMNEVNAEKIKIDGEDIEKILKQAEENFVKYLWNDEKGYFNCFYRTEGANTASIPESVFSDQMFGRWLLLTELGKKPLLPIDKIKKCMEYIYKNNLIDDKENGFRGWANGMLQDRAPYYDNKQYHAKTCWIGAQLNLGSILGELGCEDESLDVFRSVEKSFANNHLAVGEWNKAITEDGKSCTLPEEMSKDTPRFPAYPRYKCCWEYLVRILGLKMDSKNMELKPFKSFDFQITDVVLAGCRLTVEVSKDWTEIYVDGKKCAAAVFDRNTAHAVQFK